MNRLLLLVLVFASNIFSADKSVQLPSKWSALEPVIESRLTQEKKKMKLSQQDVNALITFLKDFSYEGTALSNLQKQLPKVTVELLRSVQQRDVSLKEVDKMAEYLSELLTGLALENESSFDENTSHIIGREWFEIDYSGENMTWQGQKEKYAQYGIQNFKSQALLKKFFTVESQLPYFKKIYRPRNLDFLQHE